MTLSHAMVAECFGTNLKSWSIKATTVDKPVLSIIARIAIHHKYVFEVTLEAQVRSMQTYQEVTTPKYVKIKSV